MIECRINLAKTSYKEELEYKVLDSFYFSTINAIYEKYCAYKQFKNYTPLLYKDLENSELLGYYDNNILVAFSILNIYKTHVKAEQFAWDYSNPSLRLGIRSLKTECARYKKLGYQFIYLGEYHKYKEQFDGFELL